MIWVQVAFTNEIAARATVQQAGMALLVRFVLKIVLQICSLARLDP
jgi:hypothetical protein